MFSVEQGRSSLTPTFTLYIHAGADWTRGGPRAVCFKQRGFSRTLLAAWTRSGSSSQPPDPQMIDGSMEISCVIRLSAAARGAAIS